MRKSFTSESKLKFAATLSLVLLQFSQIPTLAIAESKDSRSLTIHLTLLRIYKCQNKIQEAENELMQLKDVTQYLEFVRFLIARNSYATACPYAEEACKLEPKNSESHALLSDCLMLSGHYEAAEKEHQIAASMRKEASSENTATRARKHKPSGPLLDSGRRSMIDPPGRIMWAIAHLPANSKRLDLHIEDADIGILHEKRDDVEVIANYHDHWENENGVISQIDMSSSPNGIFLTANGHLFVSGPINIKGNEVRFAVDGVYVDGRKLPMGATNPNNDNELDVVQVLVPLDFSGQLNLTTRSGTKIDCGTRGQVDIKAGSVGDLEIIAGKDKVRFLAKPLPASR